MQEHTMWVNNITKKKGKYAFWLSVIKKSWGWATVYYNEEKRMLHTQQWLYFVEGGITLCTKQADHVKPHNYVNMIIDLDSDSNSETQVHNPLICLK